MRVYARVIGAAVVALIMITLVIMYYLRYRDAGTAFFVLALAGAAFLAYLVWPIIVWAVAGSATLFAALLLAAALMGASLYTDWFEPYRLVGIQKQQIAALERQIQDLEAANGDLTHVRVAVADLENRRRELMLAVANLEIRHADLDVTIGAGEIDTAGISQRIAKEAETLRAAEARTEAAEANAKAAAAKLAALGREIEVAEAKLSEAEAASAARANEPADVDAAVAVETNTFQVDGIQDTQVAWATVLDLEDRVTMRISRPIPVCPWRGVPKPLPRPELERVVQSTSTKSTNHPRRNVCHIGCVSARYVERN